MKNNGLKNFFQSPQRRTLFLGGSIALAALLGYGIWKYSADSAPVDVAQEALNLKFDTPLPTEGAGAGEVIAYTPPPANEAERIAKEEREKIVVAHIEKSAYADKIKPGEKGAELDCEAILRDFEGEVEKSVQDNKVSEKLLSTSNDILLGACQYDPDFKKRFMEIYSRLDKIN